MSLIFATQVGAVATVVLAVGAIVTAIFAIRAFRKQSQEVSDQAKMLKIQSDRLDEQRKINAEQTKVLELQKDELGASLAERKREAAERRRAQASRVFILAKAHPRDGEPISVISRTVKNTSQLPIYDLILLWRGETGEWIDIGDPVDLPVFMPGEQHDWATSIEPSVRIQSFLTDPSLIRAAVVFRDAAGVHWRLQSDGQLVEEAVTE